MKTKLLLLALMVLLTGCQTMKVTPISNESSSAIDKANAEMREALAATAK